VASVRRRPVSKLRLRGGYVGSCPWHPGLVAAWLPLGKAWRRGPLAKPHTPRVGPPSPRMTIWIGSPWHFQETQLTELTVRLTDHQSLT
jgi:hypothetical protein